ncbi:MAG: DUF1887 family protein [Bacteroidetes bacterium]|nr:DUF1887 family protein [Bacteroidota bacterium]
MKTIVSLVSEQTLPNLQLIKELKDDATEFWFFHSKEFSQQVDWIVNAAQLPAEAVVRHEVDAFDLEAINRKLREINYGDRDFVLNMTGGTKLWIMLFLEQFKNLGAEVYYLTGRDQTLLKIFPLKGERVLKLKSDITLDEYLKVYGLKAQYNKPLHDFEIAQRLFEYCMREAGNERAEVFKKIWLERETREFKKDRYRKALVDLGESVADFLTTLGYPAKDNILHKSDIKYLSGEWLEEYVYYKIKEELKLDEAHISTGVTLEKGGVPNEMDVLFVYRHNLYTVECKTSVRELREQPDGNLKEVTILGEVIYKSDALRPKFGLMASTAILTLSELREADGNPKNEYKQHFDRADLSRIKLITRRDLLNNSKLTELLHIRI